MARQSSSLKSFIYKDECYFYSKKCIKTLRLRLNDVGGKIKCNHRKIK